MQKGPTARSPLPCRDAPSPGETPWGRLRSGDNESNRKGSRPGGQGIQGGPVPGTWGQRLACYDPAGAGLPHAAPQPSLPDGLTYPEAVRALRRFRQDPRTAVEQGEIQVHSGDKTLAPWLRRTLASPKLDPEPGKAIGDGLWHGGSPRAEDILKARSAVVIPWSIMTNEEEPSAKTLAHFSGAAPTGLHDSLAAHAALGVRPEGRHG
jgi:hypothetical protein